MPWSTVKAAAPPKVCVPVEMLRAKAGNATSGKSNMASKRSLVSCSVTLNSSKTVWLNKYRSSAQKTVTTSIPPKTKS